MNARSSEDEQFKLKAEKYQLDLNLVIKKQQ